MNTLIKTIKTKTIDIKCQCGNIDKILVLNNNYLTDSLSITVCNKCHPFASENKVFFDEKKLIDKFKEKYNYSVADNLNNDIKKNK